MNTTDITKVPGADLYVDEGYNLCDQYGILYTYDGLNTIPLADYLRTLGPALKRRQEEPGYPTGDPELTHLYWNQMQYTWNDEGRCFGLAGIYLYVRNGVWAKPAPGRRDANGLVLLCRSDWGKNGNTVGVRAGPERLGVIRRATPNVSRLIPDDMLTNKITPRDLAMLRQGNTRMC